MAYIEIVDPATGSPIPRSEGRQRGELVATALGDNSLLSFVRYRSGDIVDLSYVPCRCGRTQGRIWPVGRSSDGTTIDGQTVYPRDILPAIETIPATRAGLFQVVHGDGAEAARLHLRVGYSSGSEHSETLVSDIRDAVATATGLWPTVDLVQNEELLKLGPPHKIPRVVPR